VLVADDNIINQRLSTALLQSRGHAVTVAGDGREAVEAMAEGDFDIVLMDVQMPRMDGVEATRAIREAEVWTGRHVPIVAITAHAMAGDRERFLEAGMDAYVPKPLDAKVLFHTMAQLLASASPAEASASPAEASASPAEASEARPIGLAELAGQTEAPGESGDGAGPDGESVIDRELALKKLGGDEELFAEIIDLYLEDAPQVFSRLRHAVNAGDAEGVWKAAHRIKGSVGSLSATQAFAAARDLESVGREGDLAAVPVAFATLELEMERLEQALNVLRTEFAT